MELEQDGKRLELRSVATGGNYFRLFALNLVIIIFTFGLGTPWVVVRTLRYVFNNVYLMGDVDFNTLSQTEEDYKDATGDDLVDMLDIGIV
ncbi:DUF898 family protein [Hufsiella arboris]|uniref:DUF898 family protein n=1 Tax=Hufsiella arboris TaxID=2695275 RepID=UPI0034E2E47C